MRRMRVEQNLMGCVLADAAHDRDGRPVAPRGTEVTEEILEKLRAKGVQHVFVEDAAFDGLRYAMTVSPETLKMASAVFQDVRSQLETGERRPLQHALFMRLARAIEADVEEVKLERSMILQPENERERDIIHALNRATLAVHLATDLRLHRHRLDVAMAALVADIGMWTLPGELLEKQAPLSEDERGQVEQHVATALSLLSPNENWSAVTKTAVFQHHERMDGSGYPRHLLGQQIHVTGRLLAICDVFSAICLVRPGRRLYTPAEAVEHIMGGAESLFDFDLVSAFHRLVPPFPVGSEVVLSTGEHAVVLEVPVNLKARPRVRIFTDSKGRRVDSFEEIDLADRRRQAVTIVGVEQ